MGINGYQGQIRAADQPNGYFPANQEIFNLIQDLTYINIDYLERIGIQAPPATRLKLNNTVIEIGKTGLYEADDVAITSIQFYENSPKNVVIDFVVSRAN